MYADSLETRITRKERIYADYTERADYAEGADVRRLIYTTNPIEGFNR